MLDLFSWSLGLLIWKMGTLLIAMPIHRNSRDEVRRAQPIAGPQGGRGGSAAGRGWRWLWGQDAMGLG